MQEETKKFEETSTSSMLSTFTFGFLGSSKLQQTRPTVKDTAWREKFRLHFPEEFERLECKPTNFKKEFEVLSEIYYSNLNKGEKALFACVKEGKVKELRRLILSEIFTTLSQLFTIRDSRGRSLISCAHKNHHEGLLNYFYALALTECTIPVSPPHKGRCDLGRRTLLHWAILCRRRKEEILFLINQGYNIDATTKGGATALSFSLDIAKQPDVAEFLIKECGANVTLGTPLLHAVRNNDIETTRLLLERGANVNMTHPVNQLTPLFLAAQYGWNEIAALLLSENYHANPNVLTAEHGTALHAAARNNDTKMVALLIQGGANKSVKDQEGKMPWEVASDPKVIAPSADAKNKLLDAVNNRVSVSGRSMYQDYRETLFVADVLGLSAEDAYNLLAEENKPSDIKFNPDTESGSIPGIGFSATKTFGNIYTRLNVEAYSGHTEYEGSTQGSSPFAAPVQLTTQNFILNSDVKLGYTFFPTKTTAAIPYFTVGYHRWQRDLPGFYIPDIGMEINNYTELYQNSFWAGGVMLQKAFTDKFFIALDVALGRTFNAGMRASPRRIAKYATVTPFYGLEGKRYFSGGLEAGYRFTKSWMLSASINQTRFGYGASAIIPLLNSYEPDSTTWRTTSALTISYLF